MDYEILTIIMIIIQGIVLPWGVYITHRSFNHEKDIAIAKALAEGKDQAMEKLEEKFNDELEKLNKKIDDMPLLIVKLMGSQK